MAIGVYTLLIGLVVGCLYVCITMVECVDREGGRTLDWFDMEKSERIVESHPSLQIQLPSAYSFDRWAAGRPELNGTWVDY